MGIHTHIYIYIYIYKYTYKLLNRRWFRTQGGMKREDMKEFFESRDMVPISIGRFFFEIYLKSDNPFTAKHTLQNLNMNVGLLIFFCAVLQRKRKSYV